MKRTRVKQVMADLALSQVGNKSIEYLTQSEYRRLMIGIQLLRDPGNRKFHIFFEKQAKSSQIIVKIYNVIFYYILLRTFFRLLSIRFIIYRFKRGSSNFGSFKTCMPNIIH